MASIKLPKRLGFLLLGIWVIVMGVNQTGWLPTISIPGYILGICAVIAGVLIIMDR